MTKFLLTCYAQFLRLYPHRFRVHYGREMQLFMRDYARERNTFALMMILFSDLLMSLPREHYREAIMRLDGKTVVSAFIGVALMAMGAGVIVLDLSNPNDKMGFFAVLIVTTMALGGAFLLMQLRDTSLRILWFVPAAYAVAAAIWIMITPIDVTDSNRAVMPVLMSLGQPIALALLYLPAVIALVPAFVRGAGTIATLVIAALAILITAVMGAYYVPAALAMVMVRAGTSRKLVPA